MKSQKATSKPAPPADLWAQMDAVVQESKPDDPGLTIAEYAQRYGVSLSGALRQLNKLVSEGKVVVGIRRLAVNGYMARVYRPK